MNRFINASAFELIYVVANYGMGSRILHKAKECGIPGGTICFGNGTVKHSVLNFFSLYDERKEIILFGTDHDTADHVLVELDKEFQFKKPNHGIVFTTDACGIVGSRCYSNKECNEKRGEIKTMYQLIISIVNKGKAEDVVSAAEAAGSKGGTIINARGSGIHETSRLFNMDIEPEREIVMILAKEDIVEAVIGSIRNKLQMDEPGNGIVFVQNVKRAYGVYE